jgi:hypothetical protein
MTFFVSVARPRTPAKRTRVAYLTLRHPLRRHHGVAFLYFLYSSARRFILGKRNKRVKVVVVFLNKHTAAFLVQAGRKFVRYLKNNAFMRAQNRRDFTDAACRLPVQAAAVMVAA